MAKDLQNCLFRVVLAPADARDTAVRRGLQLWIDMYGEFRKHAQNTRWKRLRCSVDSAGQETAFHRKRKIEVEQAGGIEKISLSLFGNIWGVYVYTNVDVAPLVLLSLTMTAGERQPPAAKETRTARTC